MSITFALVAAEAGNGSVHTLAPDHWMPFATLLARAEHWSSRRTALITAASGLGHVTVSAALGLLSVFFGLELLQRVGARLESMAGFLLIGFGALTWNLAQAPRAHLSLLPKIRQVAVGIRASTPDLWLVTPDFRLFTLV